MVVLQFGFTIIDELADSLLVLTALVLLAPPLAFIGAAGINAAVTQVDKDALTQADFFRRTRVYVLTVVLPVALGIYGAVCYAVISGLGVLLRLDKVDEDSSSLAFLLSLMFTAGIMLFVFPAFSTVFTLVLLFYLDGMGSLGNCIVRAFKAGFRNALQLWLANILVNVLISVPGGFLCMPCVFLVYAHLARQLSGKAVPVIGRAAG